MKKCSAVFTKHIFTDRSVYRLTYYVITEQNSYGIMVTSEKFKVNELITKKLPTTTQKLSETVMLKSQSFNEVMEKIKLLSDNLVFPSDLKDILCEI